MKKKLISSAVALIMLLAGITSPFALQNTDSTAAEKTKVVLHKHDKTKKSEKIGGRHSFLSDYEQYGLTYNEQEGCYYYSEKLAGLLVESDNKCLFLNRNGTVHIKAIRNDDGSLIGLSELSENEYNALIAKFIAGAKKENDRNTAVSSSGNRDKQPRLDVNRKPTSSSGRFNFSEFDFDGISSSGIKRDFPKFAFDGKILSSSGMKWDFSRFDFEGKAVSSSGIKGGDFPGFAADAKNRVSNYDFKGKSTSSGAKNKSGRFDANDKSEIASTKKNTAKLRIDNKSSSSNGTKNKSSKTDSKVKTKDSAV